MELKNPIAVYVAASNIDAQMIVELLLASGVAAYAVEDQSGVSLWAIGTITQFHKPTVWVEKQAAETAAALIREFELARTARNAPAKSDQDVLVVCEECGAETTFPGSLDGTTQECSRCCAYVDVGELDWEDDFGEPED